MKGSIIIVCIFIAGVLLQYFVGLPEFLVQNDITYYIMLLLMFVVGIGLGCDTKALSSLKSMNLKVLLVPIGTIIGTLIGAALVTPLLGGMSMFDSMAVGSGFGYYSLSSITISQIKGPEIGPTLGTIALVSNILREVLTLLLTPVFVKVFGKFAPISAAGATSMDTTLPVIVKFTGKEYAVLSIFHGIVLTILVPFIVSFFASI